MSPEEIKSILEEKIEGSEVQASGDGSHFQVIVVSDSFDGARPVKRQQMIYAHLGDKIQSGELHALSIKTYTQDEWQTAQKLQVG